MFWQNLAPKSSGGGEKPTGELLKAIESKWGSFDEFVAKFNAASAGVQGKLLIVVIVGAKKEENKINFFFHIYIHTKSFKKMNSLFLSLHLELYRLWLGLARKFKVY